MIGAIGQIGRLGLSPPRGRLLLYPQYVQDYLDRVTAADVTAGNTQGLELGVTDAFNACLQAMVADASLGVSGGVLAQAASLIKAGCFMMGARTLSGALIPLAANMPAPTNFNFVSADYDRKTGLVGDGSTKYLNSGRSNNADPQNNQHLSVYMSTAPTTGFSLIGAGVGGTGSSNILPGATRSRTAAAASFANALGFIGASRSIASSYIQRQSSTSATITATSESPGALNILVFARSDNLNNVSAYANPRLSYYSIGESLDLALPDLRVTALVNAFAAAIPA